MGAAIFRSDSRLSRQRLDDGAGRARASAMSNCRWWSADHADWDELIETFTELKPEELWITHGSEEALLRWAALNDMSATALEIAGYEDEDE